MCDVLKELYRKVYDETFEYSSFEKRIKLQKAVYLIENMGLNVGDYSFSWHKYGPYSLGLDCDALNADDSEEKEIIFSETAEAAFQKIKNFAQKAVSYSCDKWMECIASLYYLKTVYRYSEDMLIDQLVKREPYLNDTDSNQLALSLLGEIRVGF